MLQDARVVYLVLLGAFGLVFGSFANVVIWRLPRRESLRTPGSHCPACGHPIRWHDNIPVVSWVLLRRRCRDCGAAIAWRYPIVEVSSAGLWVASGVAYGYTLRAAFGVFLFYVLLLLAFIDVDTMRLPNVLVGLLAVGGVLGVAWAQYARADVLPLTVPPVAGWLTVPLAAGLAGAFCGAVPLLVTALAYRSVRGSSGVGAGDIKLLAAAGLFVSVYVLVALFLGSLVGAIVGIVLKRGHVPDLGRAKIPFGPFLATGIVISALWGPTLVSGYLAIVRSW